MSIAGNLRRLVADQEITQTQLAKASGLSNASISLYLSGRVMPSAEALQRLSDALHVEPSQLCAEETEEAREGGRRVLVADVAKRMGKNPQFVRVALQQGLLPFGLALKSPNGRWSYYINPAQYDAYMAGVQ